MTSKVFINEFSLTVNINQYLADTISHVFSEVWTVDVAYNTNRELFASNSQEMTARMQSNAQRCQDSELRGMLGRIESGLTPYEAGNYLMTDDRAPVELLSMQVIDDLIRDEVAWYKQIYKEQGIKAFIGML